MVKRTINAGNNEPEQAKFVLPTEKEHLFQVTDFFDNNYEGNKFNLDDATVIVKLEVVGGDEEGRSMLNRVSLDPHFKGFFATRLFLKVIGEPYKGDIVMDTDSWVGKQMYATVVHNASKGKTYANIGEYNFDKPVEQVKLHSKKESEEVAWDG